LRRDLPDLPDPLDLVDLPDPLDLVDLAGLDAEWPPAGMLEATEAGPVLAALVNTVCLLDLDGDRLVEVAAGAARLVAWASAREIEATAELTRRVTAWRGVGTRADQITPEQMAAAELGAALALSPLAARWRVELAKDLTRLPVTRIALAAGRIDLAKARAVVEAVAPLTDEQAGMVEARVAGRAPDQTAAQLRACLRRAVISADPAGAEGRRRIKVRDRGVWREQGQDGMARLEWVAPAEQVEATWSWLSGMAQAAQDGDRHPAVAGHRDDQPLGGEAAAPARAVRTMDQARSDVLADLGEHGLAAADLPRRHGRRPQLQVLVAYSTLIGADDEPGELAGVGPVTAQVARRIAAHGTWRRLLTAPRTGSLAEVTAGTYEPPQDMADFVIARDRTCRGLGCRVPAERCDLDHRVPHEHGGPTSPANLDARCRTEHRIKTLTDSTVEPDGAGGLWITLPSGRRYHRPAEPMLDHPGLTTDTGTPPLDATAGDPDPPIESDVPPF